jgi:hypothetical protein
MPLHPRRAGRRRQRTLGFSSKFDVAFTTMLAKYSANRRAGPDMSTSAPAGVR